MIPSVVRGGAASHPTGETLGNQGLMIATTDPRPLRGPMFRISHVLGAHRQQPAAPQSKKNARDLLRASVLYLPLLFLLMMLNAA